MSKAIVIGDIHTPDVQAGRTTPTEVQQDMVARMQRMHPEIDTYILSIHARKDER